MRIEDRTDRAMDAESKHPPPDQSDRSDPSNPSDQPATGNRSDQPARPTPPAPHCPPVPRLLADQMLARLARWLRLLGYDCALVEPGGPTADALIERARQEARTLLTSSRALAAQHPDRVLGIPHEPLDDQLRRVIDRWPLDFPSAAFTRCSLCNEPVESVADSEYAAVAAALPPRVRDQRPALTRCPTCGRVYWVGSHVDALRRAFGRSLRLPGFPEAGGR